MLRKRKEYLVLSIIAGFVMTLSLVMFAIAQMQSHGSRLSDQDKAQARDIIYAASGLTGLEDLSSERALELASGGIISASDHVISVMNSPDYLLMAKDDMSFAKDLLTVAKSCQGNDVPGAGDICDLLSDHNSAYVINKVISDRSRKMSSASLISADKGSGVEGFVMDSPIGADSGYTVGIRETTGHMNVTGKDIRTDFFVDGILYRGFLKFTGNADDGNFTLAWDTTGVEEGLHNVYALIRSSDGRGAVAGAGTINIPVMTEIEADRVTKGLLVGGADSSWYIYDCHNKDCYVNIVGADDDISASLYDVYGNLIGTVDNPGTFTEALRSHPQDIKKIEKETGIEGISNCFYVKVSKSANSTLPEEDVSYKLVQSADVAYFNGTFMAVVEKLDGGNLRLVDYNGDFYEATEDEIEYLPINAHLSSLGISDASSRSEISIWPDFNTDKFVYAKYLSKANRINVTPLACEGFAADVDVNVTDESGNRIEVTDGSFELGKGENHVAVRVVSFDGREENYDVYVLNGLPNDDFARNTLSTFPEGYYSGIWMLHKLRPAYSFTAFNVTPSFPEVLANEDSGYQSLLQYSSYPNYVKQNSIVYDAPDWMAAKNEVVSYYLDPRNFLLEDRVFMFENLSFNGKVHTREGVSAIIKGSFMDTPDYDYAQSIYEAGKTANVSPYFLASRILQEMGFSGESSLARGEVAGFEGIYNYYNIGSSASSEPGVAVANGAKFASGDDSEYMLPWNSIDKAITGGALWIAKGYISRGQDTLYFQKFDIKGKDGKYYDHQYAQNLMMAYSESMRYYKSYESTSSLDNPFEFVIPVYTDLPEQYGELPKG
ncbi:MAG: hypothetical protein J5715_09725 [Clostridiales bacterium]|nr:hypothetical protein [Clostridiales bacterium]